MVRRAPDIDWPVILLVAAIVFSFAAAAYAGFQLGHDEDRPPSAARPAPPAINGPAGGAIPVSVAPAPSSSAPPSPAFSSPALSSPALSSPASPWAASPSPTSPLPAGPTAPSAWTERIIAGTSVLTAGQSWSTNRLTLTVTTGGDLTLRDQGRTVWHTATTTGVKLVMQNDGHLVLYDATNGTAWSSGTAGNPGAVLRLRANGTMAVTLNARTLFQTGTADPSPPA
ncbi:hypothetical protein ACFY36_02970 [Actinoplanes sp. NPDC000266]